MRHFGLEGPIVGLAFLLIQPLAVFLWPCALKMGCPSWLGMLNACAQLPQSLCDTNLDEP